MAIRHEDLWRALDTLAAENGMTPSGLARAAGLDATTFNRSKRRGAGRAAALAQHGKPQPGAGRDRAPRLRGSPTWSAAHARWGMEGGSGRCG